MSLTFPSKKHRVLDDRQITIRSGAQGGLDLVENDILLFH